MSTVIKLPKQYRVAQRWLAVCYACADADNMYPPGVELLSDGRAPLVISFPRRRATMAHFDARRHDDQHHTGGDK